MAFTEKDVRAIVRTGQLSDPQAEEYLIETLLERRDKIGRAWLTTLSSFDEFGWTAGGELRFHHWASHYDFVRRPEYQIAWFTFDNAGGERQAIAQLQPKRDEGYFVGVISSTEGKVEVYVRVFAGEPQIVGVERL
jgi:hypothetical protein